MILTTEEFWCPSCGRLPQSDAYAHAYDEHGELCVPYCKLTCRRCGRDGGSFVCRGDIPNVCALVGDLCIWHGCHTGPNPFPEGVRAAKAKATSISLARANAERRERAEMGLWDGPSALGAEDDDPARGGIFR